MGVAQISWTLVGIGVALVLLPLALLARRRRPLAQALRRLHWRRAELERLRARAENLRERVDELAAIASVRSDGEVRRSVLAPDRAYDGPVRRGQ